MIWKEVPQTWSFSISYLEFWIRAEGKFTQPGVELQISKMSVHRNRCHTLKFINEFLLHFKCLLVSLVVQLKRISDSKFLGCYVCIEWSCAFILCSKTKKLFDLLWGNRFKTSTRYQSLRLLKIDSICMSLPCHCS